MPSKAKTLLALAEQQGIIRPKDLAPLGIPKEYLWQFYQRGLLERSGRGLYYLPGPQITEYHSLVEAAKRAPQGIICLLSALRFHQLTTQAPFEVWLAIDNKAYKPQSDSPPLRIVRFSGSALTTGIEEHCLEGVTVKIYCPAKTVVDCFKYRNKIGTDVAIEALKEAFAQKRTTIDEVWHYAKICRVAKIIYPYLESLT